MRGVVGASISGMVRGFPGDSSNFYFTDNAKADRYFVDNSYADPYLFNGGKNYTLPLFRAAAQNVINGSADARILCIGDSTTFGAWSTGTNVGEQTAGSYPRQLAALLRSAGLSCRNNSFMGAGTVGETIISGGDSRVTLGSGWTRTGTGSTEYTMGGVPFLNSTTTTPLSFTPNSPCDTFLVFFTRATGGSSFNLDINGGGTQLVTVTSSTTLVGQATITGALGNNTLNISRVSGTIRIIGVIATNSAQKEISIINAGWSSGFASYIADETFNADRPFRPLAMIDLLQPKLVILNFGLNESGSSFDVTNFKTLMNTIVTRSQNAGASVLLYTFVPRANGGIDAQRQPAYVEVLRQIARERTLPLVDIYNRWRFQISTTGFYGDGAIHPSALGYGDIASQLSIPVLQNI